MAKKHWLMKTEPGVYSIDDLERDDTTHRDGVRKRAEFEHIVGMAGSRL